MPSAPPRICGTCGLTNCAGHTHPWTHTKPVHRITGRKLQRLRTELFTKQPLCVRCLEQGRVTIATIRDHILNLEAGGLDTEANTQPLCVSCHDQKTEAEKQHGRAQFPDPESP